jgi:ATPase subunit of ABC transporter with duplicated ATPase domains
VGDFKGSVILVSHDEAFVSSVADEFWILDDETHRLRRFDGALADYKRLLLKAAAAK